MSIAYRTLRLYPNETQTQKLKTWIIQSTWLWQKFAALREDGKTNQQLNKLIKNMHQCPQLDGFPKYLAKATNYALHKSWLKRGSDSQRQFQVREKLEFGKHGWKYVDNVITHDILGTLRIHGDMPNDPQKLTIRYVGKKWFVDVAYHPTKNTRTINPKWAVGCDPGIATWLTTSDGAQYKQSPQALDITSRIKRLNKLQAKRTKHSNQWNEGEAEIKRLKTNLSHHQWNRAHEISKELIQSYDIVAIEKTVIGPIIQYGNTYANGDAYREASLLANWTLLQDVIEDQCEKHGVMFTRVPPPNTTKTCSSCLIINDKQALDKRTFTCSYCGYTESRDVNSGKNILRIGLNQLGY